ncbi:MAG: hypothetical protein ABJA16_10240, partial [Nakamurella sp.]
MVDRALQRHVSVRELFDAMSRFGNAHGAKASRRWVALVADGTVSPAERSLATALRRAGLTQVKAGGHVWVAGGGAGSTSRSRRSSWPSRWTR